MIENDARRDFLFLIRIFFGLWLLYVGLSKWVFIGPDAFIGFITSEFDKTWSPHALNFILASLILIAEPLFALWLLSGIKSHLAWIFTSVLMFMLLMGQTILRKDTMADNWQYLVLAVVCASLCRSMGKSETVI